MKILLGVIAIAGLGVLAWWEHTNLVSMTKERDSLLAQLKALNIRPSAVVKPSAATRILCAACKGEGVVTYDSTGSGKLVDRRTQSCPVCVGKGYRSLVVAKGKKLCPDCRGMGIVYYPEEPGHPIRSANCARCGATGLVADIR